MTTDRLRHRGMMLSATIAGLASVLLLPGLVAAHPLGNFTINHYAGITVGPDAVAVDVVLDYAEIPTFTERQRIDRNADGTLSDAEIEAERQEACRRLAPSLHLAIADRPAELVPDAAGLSFPPGAGGLPTMRLVCEYMARLAVPLQPATSIMFADTSYAERIGWREIVADGDGVALAPPDAAAPLPPGTSVSGRLTRYPTDLLSQPLDVRAMRLVASPGGAQIARFVAPDARPLTSDPAGSAADPPAAVPGGVGGELGGILGARDLTPPIVLGSLLVALVLGAAHAVSPGHGKTVMAAYLVGSRGTGRQALVLGLTVTGSHTLGVLALAAITLLASDVLPPERLYPLLGVGSGLVVVAIGGWLLRSRWRDGRERGHDRAHEHPHLHEHPDLHEHPHAHGDPHPHSHPGPHQEAHDHAIHGRETSPLRLRRLVALGLAGGLVPSASALLLLLGSLAAGRPLFGLVLVVAFGAGMAAVLAGLGLALVHAAGLVERLSRRGGLGRITAWMPVGTAVVVLVAGIVLTGQALHQVL